MTNAVPAPTFMAPSARVARTPAVRPTSWNARAIGIVRIAFGVVWAIDAWFKWQPDFLSGVTGYLTGAKDGQPVFIQDWIGFWGRVVNVNPTLFAHSVAIAETALALSLIFGIFVRFACIYGIAYSALIWSTAEGFGGPYKAGSTDIGTAVIYALLFAGLYFARSDLVFKPARRLRAALLSRTSAIATPPTLGESVALSPSSAAGAATA